MVTVAPASAVPVMSVFYHSCTLPHRLRRKHQASGDFLRLGVINQLGTDSSGIPALSVSSILTFTVVVLTGNFL